MADKKENFLEMLRNFREAEKKEYYPHALIAIGLDNHGHPAGVSTMIEGTPTEVIGMIDLLQLKLEAYKQKVIDHIYKGESLAPGSKNDLDSLEEGIKDSKARLEKLIAKLPPDIREKVQALKAKFDEAIDNRDEEAIQKLQDHIMGDLTGKKEEKDEFFKSSDDEDNFDIEDFKG